MAVLFPSAEWAAEFKKALNTNPAYAEAARNWEGDFYFIVTNVPGQAEPATMYADLYHGKCRDAQLLDDDSIYSPAFRMSAPIGVWRKVIEKKMDPIQGLITRQLKLQGDLVTIMKNVKAAKELVNSLTTIDTRFPS